MNDLVARGFIPAGLRSSPKKAECSQPETPPCLGLGALRAPTGASSLATGYLFDADINEKCSVPFDTEHFFKTPTDCQVFMPGSIACRIQRNSAVPIGESEQNLPGVLQAFWFQGRSPCSSLMRVGKPITSNASRNASAGSSSTLTMRCTSHSPRATNKAAATGGTPAV